MFELKQEKNRLMIVSLMPWGMRLVFALLSLFPLIAPYELVYKIGWTTYLHPFFMLAAFISAGAVALSAFFLFAAVAGLNSRMVFDTFTSQFVYTAQAPIVRRHTKRYPLSSIADVSVRVYDWSDSSPSYALQIEMDDGAVFDTDSSWDRSEAEEAVAQVRAFLGKV